MSMRIVPLLIAGFIGLFLGWVLGPDIDDVRDDVVARLDAQLPQIAALQNGLTGLEQRIAAAPSADQAVAALSQRLDALQASVSQQADAVAARVQEQTSAAQEQARTGLQSVTGEVQQQLTSLQEQVGALSANIDERLAQPSTPTEAPDEAAALATAIGATGAVLLPGQGAIFGGSRIDLVSIDIEAGNAVLRAEGGEDATVEEDASVEVSDSCTVRLAGVAAGAAYLMPEACAEPAAEAEPAAATPEPAAATAQLAQTPAPAAEQTEGQNAAPGGAATAQDAENGSDAPAQGAPAVPNQQPGEPSGAQEQTPGAMQGGAPAQ